MPESDWRNRAMASAYRHGTYAKLRGEPRSSCPYTDKPNRIGPTFSRAFMKAWLEGWDEADAERGRKA